MAEAARALYATRRKGADGQRFYAVQMRPSPPPLPVTHINLIQNWFEELKAKVDAKEVLVHFECFQVCRRFNRSSRVLAVQQSVVLAGLVDTTVIFTLGRAPALRGR